MIEPEQKQKTNILFNKLKESFSKIPLKLKYPQNPPCFLQQNKKPIIFLKDKKHFLSFSTTKVTLYELSSGDQIHSQPLPENFSPCFETLRAKKDLTHLYNIKDILNKKITKDNVLEFQVIYTNQNENFIIYNFIKNKSLIYKEEDEILELVNCQNEEFTTRIFKRELSCFGEESGIYAYNLSPRYKGEDAGYFRELILHVDDERVLKTIAFNSFLIIFLRGDDQEITILLYDHFAKKIIQKFDSDREALDFCYIDKNNKKVGFSGNFGIINSIENNFDLVFGNSHTFIFRIFGGNELVKIDFIRRKMSIIISSRGFIMGVEEYNKDFEYEKNLEKYRILWDGHLVYSEIPGLKLVNSQLCDITRGN